MPLLTEPRFRTLASDFAADRTLTRALAISCNSYMRRSGTAQHARRVGRLARDTALVLGHEEPAAERIRIAGLVHDVGKAWIPRDVLLKPGPLDPEEWLLIAAHPL